MVLKWLDSKFDHLEGYLKGVDKKCSDCRAHCESSRAVCEPRLLELERKLAVMGAASWRGAFVIGTAAIIGGVVSTLIAHFLRIQ
jgi:hypothetical protein